MLVPTTLFAMTMTDKLTIFMALVAIAVLLQAGVLCALFFAMKRLQSNVELVQQRALPLIDQGRELFTDLSPKVRQITTEAMRIAIIAGEQAEDVSKTAKLINHKARVHVQRADDLLNSTLGKVERTSDAMQTKVMSPVRQANAIFAGIVAAVDSLRGIEHPSRSRRFSDGDFIG